MNLNPSILAQTAVVLPPCSVCGQPFNPQLDIRIVNSKRGYTLPEPESCAVCGQVAP